MSPLRRHVRRRRSVGGVAAAGGHFTDVCEHRPHGVPTPRPQRPEGQRDHLRQLDHPRRRRSRTTPRSRASTPHSTWASRRSTPPTSTPARRPRSCSGKALHGVAPRGIEIFTKVYWPTGRGPNDRGLSRKHIMESIDASLRRLGTDYVDLYQAHRYDDETPLEETHRAFDDLVRQGKVLYIGVSRVDGGPDPRGRRSSPRPWAATASCRTSRSTRCCGGSSRTRSSRVRRAGHRADRVVADRAGRADRQVPARAAAARREPRDRSERRAKFIGRLLGDDVLTARAAAAADRRTTLGCRWRSSRSRGCSRTRTCRRRSSARRGPSRSRTT